MGIEITRENRGFLQAAFRVALTHRDEVESKLTQGGMGADFVDEELYALWQTLTPIPGESPTPLQASSRDQILAAVVEVARDHYTGPDHADFQSKAKAFLTQLSPPTAARLPIAAELMGSVDAAKQRLGLPTDNEIPVVEVADHLNQILPAISGEPTPRILSASIQNDGSVLVLTADGAVNDYPDHLLYLSVFANPDLLSRYPLLQQLHVRVPGKPGTKIVLRYDGLEFRFNPFGLRPFLYDSSRGYYNRRLDLAEFLNRLLAQTGQSVPMPRIVKAGVEMGHEGMRAILALDSSPLESDGKRAPFPIDMIAIALGSADVRIHFPFLTEVKLVDSSTGKTLYLLKWEATTKDLTQARNFHPMETEQRRRTFQLNMLRHELAVQLRRESGEASNDPLTYVASPIVSSGFGLDLNDPDTLRNAVIESLYGFRWEKPNAIGQVLSEGIRPDEFVSISFSGRDIEVRLKRADQLAKPRLALVTDQIPNQAEASWKLVDSLGSPAGMLLGTLLRNGRHSGVRGLSIVVEDPSGNVDERLVYDVARYKNLYALDQPLPFFDMSFSHDRFEIRNGSSRDVIQERLDRLSEHLEGWIEGILGQEIPVYLRFSDESTASEAIIETGQTTMEAIAMTLQALQVRADKRELADFVQRFEGVVRNTFSFLPLYAEGITIRVQKKSGAGPEIRFGQSHGQYRLDRERLSRSFGVLPAATEEISRQSIEEWLSGKGLLEALESVRFKEDGVIVTLKQEAASKFNHSFVAEALIGLYPAVLLPANVKRFLIVFVGVDGSYDVVHYTRSTTHAFLLPVEKRGQATSQEKKTIRFRPPAEAVGSLHPELARMTPQALADYVQRRHRPLVEAWAKMSAEEKALFPDILMPRGAPYVFEERYGDPLHKVGAMMENGEALAFRVAGLLARTEADDDKSRGWAYSMVGKLYFENKRNEHGLAEVARAELELLDIPAIAREAEHHIRSLYILGFLEMAGIKGAAEAYQQVDLSYYVDRVSRFLRDPLSEDPDTEDFKRAIYVLDSVVDRSGTPHPRATEIKVLYDKFIDHCRTPVRAAPARSIPAKYYLWKGDLERPVPAAFEHFVNVDGLGQLRLADIEAWFTRYERDTGVIRVDEVIFDCLDLFGNGKHLMVGFYVGPDKGHNPAFPFLRFKRRGDEQYEIVEVSGNGLDHILKAIAQSPAVRDGKLRMPSGGGNPSPAGGGESPSTDVPSTQEPTAGSGRPRVVDRTFSFPRVVQTSEPSDGTARSARKVDALTVYKALLTLAKGRDPRVTVYIQSHRSDLYRVIERALARGMNPADVITGLLASSEKRSRSAPSSVVTNPGLGVPAWMAGPASAVPPAVIPMLAH